MDCREALERMLDEPDDPECREHQRGCPECARALAEHRKAWELLAAIDAGEPDVGRVRLEQIAVTALRGAGADSIPAASEGAPAPILRFARRWAKVAAAAAVLVAATWATKLALRRSESPSSPPFATPACLDEPEFVKNFDVIRDLAELDDEGDLLDVGDEMLILQALEGA